MAFHRDAQAALLCAHKSVHTHPHALTCTHAPSLCCRLTATNTNTQVSALATLTALARLQVIARKPAAFDDLPAQAHALTALTGLRWLSINVFTPEEEPIKTDYAYTASDPQLNTAVVSWVQAMPHLECLSISNVQLGAAASRAVLCQAPNLRVLFCYSLVVPAARPEQHASKMCAVEVGPSLT